VKPILKQVFVKSQRKCAMQASFYWTMVQRQNLFAFQVLLESLIPDWNDPILTAFRQAKCSIRTGASPRITHKTSAKCLPRPTHQGLPLWFAAECALIGSLSIRNR
jgi:hypothetical protein